jgi:predicted nucleic acid-binding protein
VAVVLDTSALIELERALSRGLQLPTELRDEQVFLPSIVWSEALIGVRLAADAARAARRRAHLERVRLHAQVVHFTPEIAEHYADIFAELSISGTPIPQNDVAVAATCRFGNWSLLVGPNDEHHFARVRGLTVKVLSAETRA